MSYKDTYLKLSDFGRELLNKKSLADGIPLISKYAKEVLSSQRCSIFIYNAATNELKTTLADGIKEILIDANKGVVGHTLNEKKPLIVNDPYTNIHFLSDIDEDSGFMTHNLITAPIFNSQREIVGVLELLNKKGGYNDEDKKFMIFFAHYISGFLELVTRMDEEK